jgi:hypothetical protein
MQGVLSLSEEELDAIERHALERMTSESFDYWIKLGARDEAVAIRTQLLGASEVHGQRPWQR